MIQRIWRWFDGSSRVALAIGIACAVVAVPLPTLLAVLLGLVAAAVLGFAYPERSRRVAVVVALPALTVAFLFGFVRGFNTILLLVILVPSLIAPIWLAQQGANLRGRPSGCG